MFEFAAWLTLKHACYSILYVLLHKVYICFSQVFPLFFFLFSFFSKCKKDFLCFSKNSIVRFIAFSQLLVHTYLCVEKKKYNMLGNWKVYFLEWCILNSKASIQIGVLKRKKTDRNTKCAWLLLRSHKNMKKNFNINQAMARFKA